MNLRVAIQKVAVWGNIGNQPFQGVGTPRIFVGFLTPEQALDDVPHKYCLESDHYEETVGYNYPGFLIGNQLGESVSYTHLTLPTILRV